MIINGSCLDEMRKMADNSISAIVTDPPYGLHFMGKHWDGTIPATEIWAEALRVCKPGSMLAAFGGSRTHHHLMMAIEGGGWEIRDVIMWIYGSGFPKSHNHFGIPGYGTALKPAYEPIILAMKPLDGTFKQNAEKWGQAGINIDGCRIIFSSEKEANKHASEWDRTWTNSPIHKFDSEIGNHPGAKREIGDGPKPQQGRWPANVIFDEEAGALLDQMSGVNACRFFYCAKASPSERNAGCEGVPIKTNVEHRHGRYRCKKCNKLKLDHKPCVCIEPDFERIETNHNNHPTVKPLKLMEYLIKLIMPPKDGVILDPFAGSGTTLIAAKQLGINAIGIEKETDYCEIARKRLESFVLPLFEREGM
jgi:DNA modification methylase